MGCGTSSHKGNEQNEDKFDWSRRNTLVAKPDVTVEIGQGIKKIDKTKKVVFIFGGPGSSKGCVISDLVQMFGFAFVSAEDLILQKLPEKVASNIPEPITGTHGIATFLKENPHHLTLEWVLEIVGEELLKHPNKPVLVDMIPNLKFLMQAKTFIKNCDREMAAFEEKFPCAFAINMTLSKETLLKNIKNSHSSACVKTPSQNPKDASTDQGDEMDTKRTQRRFNIYLNSVKDFLNYFSKDDRLVKVDTSAAQVQHIWEAVKDFFAAEMDFEASRGLNTVVLFTFDEKSSQSIDTDRYPMKEVVLKNLAQDPYAPVAKLLSVLSQHLDESALQTRSFLVDVSNTSMANIDHIPGNSTPTIMFVDVDVGQLDYFLHGLRRKTDRKKSVFRKRAQIYKAVCSTENETLLFPEDTDTDICRKIALYMTTLRDCPN